MIIAQQKSTVLYNAILCSAGCIVFAWFIHYPFPFQLAAFVSLIAFMISIRLNSSDDLLKKSFSGFFSSRMMVFNLTGLLMGTAAALYYRNSYGMLLFPQTFKNFTFIAIAIAVTEELVFRGFIQGQLSKLNPSFSIAFGALSHVAYKAALFLSPFAVIKIDVVSLTLFSLPVILILGVLKHCAKSILPAVIAHAAFDIIVYAEVTKAPWWVW